MNVSHLRRLDNALKIGVVGSECDVVLNGIGEEEVVLRNVRRSGAYLLYRNVVYVLAVDKESSLGNVVGAKDKVNEGGLARARSSDDTDVLARVYLEGYVGEHLLVSVGIYEGKISEFNVALDLTCRDNALSVGDGRLRVKQSAYSLERRLTLSVHTDKLGDSHNGPDYSREVADELNEASRIKRAVPHEVAAVSEDNAGDRLDEESERDVKHHRELGVAYVDVLVLLAELLELKQLVSFLNERLDNGYSRKGLLREIRKA